MGFPDVEGYSWAAYVPVEGLPVGPVVLAVRMKALTAGVVVAPAVVLLLFGFPALGWWCLFVGLSIVGYPLAGNIEGKYRSLVSANLNLNLLFGYFYLPGVDTSEVVYPDILRH